MIDWMVRRIPITKLPWRMGVALDRILAKANPAETARKIIANVDAMVKNKLLRNRVPNLPSFQALV